MRDVLPPHAAARRVLARAVMESFARWGYELVTTPPFEHAEVIERGIETIDRRDLLRFVDSDTGEVALLRPDITPQIARVVATHLADRPPPHRLAYEGSVIRRRRGRARRQRQIAQAGVECIGLPGPGADAEVIELASRTLDSLGLLAHRIELGLSPLARTAIDAMPEPLRAEAMAGLSSKDRSAIEALAARAGLRGRSRATLIEMVDLWGGPEVLERARRVLGEGARALLETLDEVHARLAERGLGDRIAFDLGEARGFGYYTGPSFVLLAHGPGEPIGGGGRYDELLARFGTSLPATGFGLDLDHLEWALASAGLVPYNEEARRIVVTGEDRAAIELAADLRQLGLSAASVPPRDLEDVLAYARAWGHDAVAVIARQVRAVKLEGESRTFRREGAGRAIAAWIGGARSTR